jgi:hypothetical protein
VPGAASAAVEEIVVGVEDHGGDAGGGEVRRVWPKKVGRGSV